MHVFRRAAVDGTNGGIGKDGRIAKAGNPRLGGMGWCGSGGVKLVPHLLERVVGGFEPDVGDTESTDGAFYATTAVRVGPEIMAGEPGGLPINIPNQFLYCVIICAIV